ncbi:MAG: hypothetical protein LBI59_11635, partial [Candidatus Accumulibacter sp.]|nr:hypothetical protein [Accumulibacter sp.]
RGEKSFAHTACEESGDGIRRPDAGAKDFSPLRNPLAGETLTAAHCYTLIPNHFPGKIEKLERGRPARNKYHEAGGTPALPYPSPLPGKQRNSYDIGIHAIALGSGCFNPRP